MAKTCHIIRGEVYVIHKLGDTVAKIQHGYYL
jgi:hypothetical protein